MRIQKLVEPVPRKLPVGTSNPYLPEYSLDIGTLVDKLNELIDAVNALERLAESDAHGI